ncbi:DUF3618 domain-containing protein [Micromonospora fluostatini]|uniref:DUF3618 domain-containing protein n=1 Tax=Micromonospora sp. JCM 30529 TaxID=3421643 RepID=UPI003D1630CD
MSNDPDQIRQEIDATRVELSTDVDALADKANPRRVATERIERARVRFSRVKDRVMGSAAKAGPDGGHPAAQARRRVSDTAHQASGAVSGAADRVAHVASSAAHQAQAAPHVTREKTEGNPPAVGLIAFGVGLLASSLVPPSRTEQRLAGEAKQRAMRHSGQIKQQAGQAAHQMQENLRQPAQQAAQSVMAKAGDSASALRDQGTAVAHHLQGQARESRDDLRR